MTPRETVSVGAPAKHATLRTRSRREAFACLVGRALQVLSHASAKRVLSADRGSR
jgi:hypothetical protein